MLQSSSQRTLNSAAPTVSVQRPVVMLFDLLASGHHPVYIQHLVQHWHQKQLPGTLHVVVSPEFMQRHSDVVALTLATEQSCISFTAVSEAEYAVFKQAGSLLAQSWCEWKLFCGYARKLKATQGVLMYLDSMQVPLCIGQKSPCPVSGIYFRPTFHYPELPNYVESWRDRARRWRQQITLAQVLRNPQLKNLFCLDPLAIAALCKLNSRSRARVLALADPVELHTPDAAALAQFQQNLGVEPGRKVLLLFGELSQRKGILKVLQALQQLPAETARQVCLLLAGPIAEAQRSRIEAEIANLQTSPVQLIVLGYIKTQQVPYCFEVADIVLATYQRHVGMSSILVHAAAHQKPVISSDFGLMGAIVNRYALGITLDSTDPTQIAAAIARVVSEDAIAIDPARAKQFIQQNLVGQFVETILQNLLD